MSKHHKDDFRAAATNQSASNLQIYWEGQKYHYPEPSLEYTPMGDMWIDVLSREQEAKNEKITDKRLFMMRRLQKQQNKAKTNLNEAANRRSGQDRRQKDNDNGR